MNPTARRNTRHYLLQAMYQWQISGAAPKEIEEQFIATQIKKELDLDYFKELLHAIPEQLEILDALIKPFLTRPLAELDPVELATLRIASYELVNRLDVPYRVIINEALDLTKKFGSIEGYKFVNGVLDQVARKIRTVEINVNKK